MLEALRDPIDIYAIDVSFPQLDDPAEVAYLNSLPTSIVRPDEAVDRLRAAARRIIAQSPEFKRLVREAGAQPLIAGRSIEGREATRMNRLRSPRKRRQSCFQTPSGEA